MRIIKQAEPGDTLWTLNVLCSGVGNNNDGCGSELEINGNDLFKTSSMCYGDSSPTNYLTIECPVCKVWTDIKDKEVPAGLISKVFSGKARTPSGK